MFEGTCEQLPISRARVWSRRPTQRVTRAASGRFLHRDWARHACSQDPKAGGEIRTGESAAGARERRRAAVVEVAFRPRLRPAKAGSLLSVPCAQLLTKVPRECAADLRALGHPPSPPPTAHIIHSVIILNVLGQYLKQKQNLSHCGRGYHRSIYLSKVFGREGSRDALVPRHPPVKRSACSMLPSVA